MGQKVYNKLEQLRDSLINSNPKSILFVTGGKSFEASGAEKILKDLLERETSKRYCQTAEKPDISSIKECIKVYDALKPKVVLAIGGGKAMDTAKATIGLAGVEDPEKAVEENKGFVDNKGILIAVPTTAGSGAESTPFVVVYDSKGTKRSLQDGNRFLPREIVLDHTLTYSLSPRDTATSGLDALAQATESYWSVNATEETKIGSAKAMRMLLKYLEPVVNDPNPENRWGMMLGANLAALKLARVKSTWPHASSYEATSKYGIPHGQAVGVTLGKILRLNFDVNEGNCNDKRGVSYVQKTMGEVLDIFGVSSPQEAEKMWYGIMRDIGLESDLLKMGVDRSGIEKMVDNVNPQRLGNHPVMPTKDEIRMVLLN